MLVANPFNVKIVCIAWSYSCSLARSLAHQHKTFILRWMKKKNVIHFAKIIIFTASIYDFCFSTRGLWNASVLCARAIDIVHTNYVSIWLWTRVELIRLTVHLIFCDSRMQQPTERETKRNTVSSERANERIFCTCSVTMAKCTPCVGRNWSPAEKLLIQQHKTKLHSFTWWVWASTMLVHVYAYHVYVSTSRIK